MLTAFSGKDGVLCRTAEPLSRAQWIDLLQPTPEEIELVTQETGLAIPTEADLNEIQSSSRLANRGGTLYLSLPIVTRPETDPQSVPVGFVLSANQLITVRFGISRLFDRFMEENDMGMPSAAHIIVALLNAIVARQADALQHVKTQLEALSHGIFSHEMVTVSGRKGDDTMLRSTLVTLGRIGDLISRVRESQVSAGLIVPYLEGAAKEWLPKDLKPRLHTLRRDIASLNDYDTHLTDKLQFLLDATLGFINIAQNNVMKVLTVVSVVGIPPVLVAGIYGMNFKGMPELEWAWGYAWGLGVVFLSGLIPLAFFIKRKWI